MNDLAAIKVIKLEPGECNVRKVSGGHMVVTIDFLIRLFVDLSLCTKYSFREVSL